LLTCNSPFIVNTASKITMTTRGFKGKQIYMGDRK
jgi:hypothetical protein